MSKPVFDETKYDSTYVKHRKLREAAKAFEAWASEQVAFAENHYERCKEMTTIDGEHKPGFCDADWQERHEALGALSAYTFCLEKFRELNK